MTLSLPAARLFRRRHSRRTPAVPDSCFACANALSIGPSCRRGFCAECWERSRMAAGDAELGGEA